MGLFNRSRQARKNQSLDFGGLGLLLGRLQVEPNLVIILLGFTWTTVRDLLTEVAHERQTLVQLLTANHAGSLITGPDIREALIVRVVFRRCMNRRIRMPLVDIHSYEVARA